MADKTYTQAEVNAMLAAAAGSTDLDAIAARPYHRITHADGSVMCFPPAEGGPLTISGQHPDDYYGVEKDDKGVVKLDANGNTKATQNADDAVKKPDAKPATPATGGTN